MEKILNESNAVKLLERYFSALKESGYVSGNVMCRFFLYMFLVDFADVMFTFLTDKDYRKIYDLTANLFSNGGCLMPYPSFCDKGLVAGMPYVMGSVAFRNTERPSGDQLRSTEDDNLRRV